MVTELLPGMKNFFACLIVSFFAVSSFALAQNKPQGTKPAQNQTEPKETGVSDGMNVKASFSDVSGMETEQPVVEYRTGDEDRVVRSKTKAKAEGEKAKAKKEKEEKTGKEKSKEKPETPVQKPDPSTKASFSEASGLETEQSPVDYRTGKEDSTIRKTPGLKKNPFADQVGLRSVNARDMNSMMNREDHQEQKREK